MERHRPYSPALNGPVRCPPWFPPRWAWIAALLGCLWLPVPLSAEPGPADAEQALNAKLRQRGDLTLRDVTLTEALFSVSETWGVNLVVGDVDGRVNGVFRQAALNEILDAILLTNGYSYRPVGESLVIMRIEQLGDANPLFTTAIVPLRHVAPGEILTALQVLSSPRGKVHAIEPTKSLLVIDFHDRVRMIRDRALDLDEAALRGGDGPARSLGVAYFTPQYIRVQTVRDALTNLLSEDGKLAVIPEENRIVVTDYDHKLRQVQLAVEQLDVPRPQVRIMALIYDIGLEDMERLGINFSQGVNSSDTTAGVPNSLWAIDAITTVAPAIGAANGTMTFMNMSRNFDLRAVVHALQQAGDSRLLADPNVTVLDNETAMMAVVREIPYQQLTQTGQGGNIGTTAFREAGVKLEVRPHIAADGTIAMEVVPSFSRLTGFTPDDNQPIIDRREARTSVRVANGQTLVIGGLRQRSDIGEYSGIPYLKDLKGVGKLFRSRQTTVTESELVVFVTPYIVPVDHTGRVREQAAFDTGQCWLGRIPHGTRCPDYVCDEDEHPLYRPAPRHETVPAPSAEPLAPEPQAADPSGGGSQLAITAGNRHPQMPRRLPPPPQDSSRESSEGPRRLPAGPPQAPPADSAADNRWSPTREEPLRQSYSVRFRDTDPGIARPPAPSQPPPSAPQLGPPTGTPSAPVESAPPATAHREPNWFEKIFRH